MKYLNAVLNAIGDLTLSGFRWENPWPALIVASLLSTVVLLLVIRVAAAPAAIMRSKKKLIARVMELHLFRHDPIVTLTACLRIFRSNLVYFRHLARPIGAALIPGLLILIQLDCWFSKRPLRVGETAIVEVELAQKNSVISDDLTVTESDSLSIDSPVLRIPSMNQVNWRLRILKMQDGWIDVTLGGQTVRKQVSVGNSLSKISERRVRAAAWETLFNPAEPPIAVSSMIDAIRIRYPRRKIYVGLQEIDWLVAFFALTVLFGAVLKAPLKVPL